MSIPRQKNDVFRGTKDTHDEYSIPRQKMTYFVNISHNPMNFDPKFKFTTSDGVVKIWGLLFFGIFPNFLSESVQPPVCIRMIYDKSQKSVKTDLSKPFRSSFAPYQMIQTVEIERGRAPRIILLSQYNCMHSSI